MRLRLFVHGRNSSVLLKLLLDTLEFNVFVSLLLFFLEIDLELQVGYDVLLDVVFIRASLGVIIVLVHF